MLLEEGQQHICAFWPPVGINDAQKKALTKQLMDADAICPQGLQAYIQSARRLLEDSKLERNPFEGCRASVPEGVTISAGATTGTFEQYERSGLQASKHCAFVLVAGGLGERLGYHGIKVWCPQT
jgi:UDP-sugar pyrophosphorylase